MVEGSQVLLLAPAMSIMKTISAHRVIITGETWVLHEVNDGEFDMMPVSLGYLRKKYEQEIKQEEFDTYQTKASAYRVDGATPEERVMGLLEEAGEVASVFKRLMQGIMVMM